jgi:four helix bundle suffix protein
MPVNLQTAPTIFKVLKKKSTSYLLARQIQALERKFLEEGGLRERMTRARLLPRTNAAPGSTISQWRSIVGFESPALSHPPRNQKATAFPPSGSVALLLWTYF